MSSYSLTQSGILRPERVMWISPLTPDQPILDVIRSKSLRKFLSRVEERCAEFGVTREIFPLTQETYDIWRAFYVKKMTDQGYDIMARPEWFAEKQAMGKTVYGIRYTQNGNVVGGSVILEDSDRLTMAYKASERIDLGTDEAANLGVVLEYDFLVFAQSKRKIASGGSSRNAFGVFNTLGYLAFKLRLGYTLVLNPEIAQVDSVPLSPKGTIIFFGLKPGKRYDQSQVLDSFYCTPHPDDLREISEIQRNLPELEIITL